MSDRARIEAFLEMMSAERGAAANTLDAYARDLADASEFCAGDLTGATGRDLAAWQADLSARGMAASTSARKLSAARRYFRFLFEEGDRKDDPTAKIDGPKTTREVPDVLSREELGQLINACGDDLRLKCLVELLYGAGLRASELVSLTLGSLPRRKGARWVTQDVIIRGKGGKERLCPLGGPALASLSDWLAVREGSLPAGGLAHGRAEPFLFPSRGKQGHLTRRRLGQMLDALARRQSRPRPCPPACLAPRLCHPPAARRRRPQERSDPARPCRYRDDPDLHPCPDRRARRTARNQPPAGPARLILK